MFAIINAAGHLYATWNILGTQPEIYTNREDADLVARTAYAGKSRVVEVSIVVKP